MIPDYYEFRSATKVCSGAHAIEHVPFELANLGVARVLVITDKRVRELGLVRPLLDALADSDVETAAVYDEVPVDSSVEVANAVPSCTARPAARASSPWAAVPCSIPPKAPVSCSPRGAPTFWRCAAPRS